MYHSGRFDARNWAVPLRTIGWLEHPHAFATGPAPDGLVAKLARLVERTRAQFPHYGFRGVHDCSLCSAIGDETGGGGWSQENLFVPGSAEVFVAPGGIVHYVADHSYLPPASFTAAVMTCPDCGSPEYFAELRRANLGKDVPLESKEELKERTRAERQARIERSAAVGRKP